MNVIDESDKITKLPPTVCVKHPDIIQNTC